MNKKIKRAWKKFKEWLPWIIAAFTALSVNLAAEAIIGTFEIWANGEPGCFSKLRFGYLIFFLICVCFFIGFRKKFFPPRTRYLKEEPTEKRKHLVLFLSNLRSEFEKTGGIPEWLKLSDDIHRDIKYIESKKKENPYWKWEMPLRAIAYHLGEGTQKGKTLETVTIICSKESIRQINLFYNICMQYTLLRNKTFYLLTKKSEHNTIVSLASSTDITLFHGYDFEDFNEIVGAMESLLYEFGSKKYLHKDIMVDITGGQKPTSIVAAAMTFNLKIKAQYVQTNDPCKIKSYDVVLLSPDTKGLGI